MVAAVTDNQRNNDNEGISTHQLRTDLKGIGLGEGDKVALGVSFKSIGSVTSGPEGLIEALLNVVGQAGTVMIPTFSRVYPLDAIAAGKVEQIYSPHTTPSTTGLVPETMRAHRDATRSRHPSNSITAIGRHAEYLTRDHNESAGAYSPYAKLAEIDGKFLGIGIGDRVVGLRHQAQAQADLLDLLPPVYGVRYRDQSGEVKVFIRRDVGGCTKRLPELVQILRSRGLVHDGVIGQAKSLLMSAKEALREMTSMLTKDPSINLCDKADCRWCQALSRRLANEKRSNGDPYDA